MEEQEKNSIRLVAYLEGTLSAAEADQLKEELSASPSLQEEWANLKELYSAIEGAEEQHPSDRVDEQFYHFLEQEKAKQSTTGKHFSLLSWRSLAAAISLLLVATLSYTVQLKQGQQTQISRLQLEMKETKKLLILSMLQNPSASDRLQAVNVSISETKVDDQILQALVHALNYDDNVNVRLKAVQAMSQFLEEKEVVNMLLKSLLRQSYPQVQIALIEALTIARKKEAVKTFELLLEREELLEVVKGKAAEGIGTLL